MSNVIELDKFEVVVDFDNCFEYGTMNDYRRFLELINKLYIDVNSSEKYYSKFLKIDIFKNILDKLYDLREKTCQLEEYIEYGSVKYREDMGWSKNDAFVIGSVRYVTRFTLEEAIFLCKVLEYLKNNINDIIGYMHYDIGDYVLNIGNIKKHLEHRITYCLMNSLFNLKE